MAPTAYWLEAGADVLWIDKVPLPLEWQTGYFPGRLYWPTQPIDLLTEAESALAALVALLIPVQCTLAICIRTRRDARGRLTGVMNAIVDALPAEAVQTGVCCCRQQRPQPSNPMIKLPVKTGGQSGPLGSVGCAHSSLRLRDTLITRVLFLILCCDSRGKLSGSSYFGKTMMAESGNPTRGFGYRL